MSARTRITITVSADGLLASIRGWRAVDLAREAGLKPIWLGRRGWTVDQDRLGDLLAYLQHRRIAVSYEGGARRDDQLEARGDDQLLLFGDGGVS